jgi:predicted PurR-regulated permease PerM
MADPKDEGAKPAASLPVVPTRITANQVIACLLLLFALRYAEGVLAPLMLALLGSLALAPPVRALSRVVPRWMASAVVVVVIASAFGVTAYLLSDEVTAFSRRLPSLVRDVRAAVASASPRQGLLAQLQQAVSELERTTERPSPGGATPVTIVEPVDVQRGMLTGARSLASYLGQGVMLLFLVYFLLASGDMFKQKPRGRPRSSTRCPSKPSRGGQCPARPSPTPGR